MFRFKFEDGIQFLDFERYTVEFLLMLGLFIILEWHAREREHFIAGKWATLKALVIVMIILILGVFSSPRDFIYFQF